MNRRSLIKLGAAGAGAALLGTTVRAHWASAAPFGEFPAKAMDALLPVGQRAESVLEIFLDGGLSPWETLYYVPEYGRPDDPDPELRNTQAYALPDDLAAMRLGCGIPSDAPDGVPFARDAAGAMVQLGPLAARLRSLDHLTSRMRLVVQKHELEPHEGASPLALTGRPVGQPSAAGLGAHIQRYFGERADAGPGSPLSYLFVSAHSAGGPATAAAAATIGMHPGGVRPLNIALDGMDGFTELLARGAVGDLAARSRYDGVVDAYLARYRRRLRWRGQGEPTRAPHVTDLESAVSATENVDAIAAALDPTLFQPMAGAACDDRADLDLPGMSLEAARHLLTHPSRRARYVCVSDVGLHRASGNGGYDGHHDSTAITARNFDNVVRNLDRIVNRPGEGDPTKLDLDRTLIVLNTEFGRTPGRQLFNGGSNGRNHHPYGYVTAFLGGPVTTERAGVYGAIGRDGRATADHATPAENRIAALLALGIWPFAPEGFSVADVPGAGSDAEGAASVLSRLLGVRR